VGGRQDECAGERAGAVEQLRLIAGCGIRAAETDSNGRGRVVGAAAIRHHACYREYIIAHLGDGRYAWWRCVDSDGLGVQGRSAAGRSIRQADGISSVRQRSPGVIEAPAVVPRRGIGGDRPNQRSLAAIAGAVDAPGYPNPERADAHLLTAEYQGVVIGYEIAHRSTICRDCGERGLFWRPEAG